MVSMTRQSSSRLTVLFDINQFNDLVSLVGMILSNSPTFIDIISRCSMRWSVDLAYQYHKQYIAPTFSDAVPAGGLTPPLTSAQVDVEHELLLIF